MDYLEQFGGVLRPGGGEVLGPGPGEDLGPGPEEGPRVGAGVQEME